MSRFVISDIHGCSKTLKALVDRIGLTKLDSLYFLGDYIDKGIDSAGVVEFIMKLKNEGFLIETVRGNHEENMLNAIQNYEPAFFQNYVIKICKSSNLLDENGLLIPKYFNFFNSLPYFIELDDFWLVHAGFDTRNEFTFQNRIAMLEIRGMIFDEQKLKGKTVVHGHQMTYLGDIQAAIKKRDKIIPLDNGCVKTKSNRYYDHHRLGNLCCLNLDTWELTIQKNIDI